MPVYKATLIFTAEGYGWTESYYLSNGQGGTLQTVYQQFIQPIVGLRLAMLATDVQLAYVRLGIVGTPFAVQLFTIGVQGQYPTTAVMSNLALLIRFSPTTPGAGKSLFLRGIPNTIVTAGNYTPTAQFTSAYTQWKQALTNPFGPVFGWMGVLSKLTSQITTYTQATQVPNIYQVTVLIANPIIPVGVVGTKGLMRFTGINGKSELNGKQVGYFTSTTSFLTKDQFGVIPYSHGGTATYEFYGFIQAGNTTAERIMTRKAGRELFLERGRAAVRVRT
jgi:hypothetical protein